MADAVNYTLGQWDALTVFTTDGAVPIDNNVSVRDWIATISPIKR